MFCIVLFVHQRLQQYCLCSDGRGKKMAAQHFDELKYRDESYTHIPFDNYDY